MRRLGVVVIIIAAFVALVGCGGSAKSGSVKQYVGTWADEVDCLQWGCGGAAIDFTVIESNGSLSIPDQPVDAVTGGYTHSRLDTSNGTLKFTLTFDGKADGGFCVDAYVLHRSGANLVGTYTYSCGEFSTGPGTSRPAEAGGPINITFAPESGPGWRDGK